MRHSNSYKVEHYLKKSNGIKLIVESHLSQPGESKLTKVVKNVPFIVAMSFGTNVLKSS